MSVALAASDAESGGGIEELTEDDIESLFK
jgi:hypothetical protein